MTEHGDRWRWSLAGLQFLAGQQAADGHFASQVSLVPSMENCFEERSVYLHSYILQSLADTRGGLIPELAEMIRKAVRDLRSARGESGWWNFYGPSRTEPPDDADDTAVAFAALLSAPGPGAGQLASEARDWLNRLELIQSESGLFKTWFDPGWNAESFELPDVVVNTNILFLQGIAGEPDARVVEYLVRVIETGTYQQLNLFGVAPGAVPFLISRCDRSRHVPALRAAMPTMCERVVRQQRPDGGWGGDLDTVLALLTLLNSGRFASRSLGQPVRRAVRCLLDRQQPDGGWASGPLFRDLHPRYYGSRSLTTALCLEALSRIRVDVYRRLPRVDESARRGERLGGGSPEEPPSAPDVM